MRKLANRMQFGIAEESSLGMKLLTLIQCFLFFIFYFILSLLRILIGISIGVLGDGLGEGYGMLGQAGSGKLRVSMGQNKLAAKAAKKYVNLLFEY